MNETIFHFAQHCPDQQDLQLNPIVPLITSGKIDVADAIQKINSFGVITFDVLPHEILNLNSIPSKEKNFLFSLDPVSLSLEKARKLSESSKGGKQFF